MLTGTRGAAESTVFGSGERLPLMHAAMLNAYQIHSQEFDCVHERAVVHPMAAVLPALLGWAEREGGVTGTQLLRATVVAVDIARQHWDYVREPRCGSSGQPMPRASAQRSVSQCWPGWMRGG